MALVGVRRLAADIASQGADADQHAHQADPSLAIRREGEHLPIPLEQGGEQPLRHDLPIMQVEVDQVVELVRPTHLPEVDDTGVPAVVLIDMGHVEIAVRQPGLFDV